MFTLQKMCPITSVDSYYDPITERFLLLIADEMGYVRIQDISSILKEYPGIVPTDLVTNNPKRNPWRVLAIDKAEASKLDDSDYHQGYEKAGSGDDEVSEIYDKDVEPILMVF